MFSSQSIVLDKKTKTKLEHTEWSITCLTLGEQKSKQKVKMTEKCVHLQVKPLERIMICSYFVVMATAT